MLAVYVALQPFWKKVRIEWLEATGMHSIFVYNLECRYWYSHLPHSNILAFDPELVAAYVESMFNHCGIDTMIAIMMLHKLQML